MNKPQSSGIELLYDLVAPWWPLALAHVAVFEGSELDSLIESRLAMEYPELTQSQQMMWTSDQNMHVCKPSAFQ